MWDTKGHQAKLVSLPCVPWSWVVQQEFVFHMFALSPLPVNCPLSLLKSQILTSLSLIQNDIEASTAQWVLGFPIPSMYVYNPFGHFLLIFCPMLIWLLILPEEFRIEGKLFFQPPQYIHAVCPLLVFCVSSPRVHVYCFF